MLFKNFLIEDINKDDKINVKTLYMHLFPSGEDKPEIKSKMNCVTDFIEYLKENPDIKFETEFKGTMTHEEFEKSLSDIGFNAPVSSINKLKEAFTNTKDPEKISKNLIKRNINLLAPEVLNKDKAKVKMEVKDNLSNLDPKVKTTLTKINEYLRRERLDTLTFFQY